MNTTTVSAKEETFLALIPCCDCDGAGHVAGRKPWKGETCSECMDGYREVIYSVGDIENGLDLTYIIPEQRILALNALAKTNSHEALMVAEEAYFSLSSEAKEMISPVRASRLQSEANRLRSWITLSKDLYKSVKLANSIYRQAAEIVRTSITLEDAYRKLTTRIVAL